MLEKHSPGPGLNTVCKLAYVKHTALEGSMEMNPGWFEAAITLHSAYETVFFSWLLGPVPWLCPLLIQVRADLMGLVLLLLLDPYPASFLASFGASFTCQFTRKVTL